MSMDVYDDYIEVETLSLRARKAVSTEGELGDIIVFFDDEGDETEDMEEAVVGIVQWPDESLSDIDIWDYPLSELVH